MRIIEKSISMVFGLILGAGIIYASRTSTLIPMILLPGCLLLFLTGIFYPRVGIGILLISIPFPSSYLYFGLPWFSWTQWFFLAFLAGYLLRGRPLIQGWTRFEWAGCALLALLVIHAAVLVSPIKLNSVYSSYFIAKDGRRGAIAYLLYAAQQDPWFCIRIVLGWVTGVRRLLPAERNGCQEKHFLLFPGCICWREYHPFSVWILSMYNRVRDGRILVIPGTMAYQFPVR